MVFRIVFICDEVEDFIREITIDADATFLALNKAILETCGYADDQITSFYTCNDEWEPEDQITREDMGVTSADQDIYIMEKTVLRDLIHDEDQKLTYVFDPFKDSIFYMKVTEFILGQTQKEAICTKSEGSAPKQLENLESTPLNGAAINEAELLGDDNKYFGSEDFNQEDFDPEGYEIEEH